VSIFFTAYVFFQLWNEINCRSLVPDVSGFHGLTRNPTFLAVVGVIVIGQVLIVSLGDSMFQIEPLGIVVWLAITALTASVLILAEVTRRVRPEACPVRGGFKRSHPAQPQVDG
jgi:Ca2+-transporting ATPase